VSDEEEDTFSLQTLCMCVQFSRVSLCVGNGGLWRNIYIYEVCFPLILGLFSFHTRSRTNKHGISPQNGWPMCWNQCHGSR